MNGCRDRRSLLLPDAAVETTLTFSFLLKPSLILKEDMTLSLPWSCVSMVFFSE